MNTNGSLCRRAFLKTGAAATAGLTAGAWSATWAGESNGKTKVWVLHGSSKQDLIRRAVEIIDGNGGYGSHADTLTLKVNAAWTRTPEDGANTHPELIEAFLKASRDMGCKTLLTPEHPCHRGETCFVRSGFSEAAKNAGAKVIDLKNVKDSFVAVDIPRGRSLKKAKVASEFIETDVLVNMPVAKHHSGATLSIAMKNWMGIVEDRQWWHRNDLHQCIADFCTFIEPRWTLVDATRIMMDKGPQGPSRNMKNPNLLIVSRDQVAADAVASRLFHSSVNEVKYLKIAGEMGLGETDLSRMDIQRIEV